MSQSYHLSEWQLLGLMAFSLALGNIAAQQPITAVDVGASVLATGATVISGKLVLDLIRHFTNEVKA